MLEGDALADSLAFKSPLAGSEPGNLHDLLYSISDCSFTPSGDFILSRDFMSVYIWDVRKQDKPVNSIDVHEHLRPALEDLYQNDCIFDKFNLRSSLNGR